MRRPHQRLRRGATLIELLVALLLLDLALLSLATMSAVAARRIGDASRRHRAAIGAVNRVERISARPCGDRTSGSDTLEPNVFETWDVHAIPLAMEVVDSVELRVRAVDRLVVRTRVPC